MWWRQSRNYQWELPVDAGMYIFNRKYSASLVYIVKTKTLISKIRIKWRLFWGVVGLKVLSYGDLCMPASPPSPIWAFILMVSSSPFGIDYGGKTIVVVMLLMHSSVWKICCEPSPSLGGANMACPPGVKCKPVGESLIAFGSFSAELCIAWWLHIQCYCMLARSNV